MLLEVSGGRKADVLAKKVLAAIVRELKSPDVLGRISSKMPAQVVVEADEIGLPPGVIEYLQLDFNFDPRLGMQEVSTNAAYVKSDFASRIEVEISYPNRPFRIKDLADVYPELLENVRHEMEHALLQDHNASQSSPEELATLNDFKAYYADESEVQAFVAGLMAKAKATGAPLTQLISDKVDAIIDDAAESGVEENELENLNAYLHTIYKAYASKRYPSMR